MRRLIPLLLVVLAAIVLPSVSQAQESDPVLVTNVGQTGGDNLATTANFASYAQSFKTGSHPDGYFLSSVDLGLAAATGVTAKVELWRSDLLFGGDYPHAFGEALDHHNPLIGLFYIPHGDGLLAELSVVGNIDSDALTLETFSAHDVLLLPDTTYWIVVTRTGDADGALSLATTTAEGAVDQGGMAGFALGLNLWARDLRKLDDHKFLLGWADHTAAINASLKISLRGSEATRPPGPYGTNRNQQPRAAVAETSTTVARLATSFRTSVDFSDFDRQNIFRSSYQLTSVLLSVAAESGTVPRVTIHADSNGRPAADPLTNGTLTTPAGISTALGAPGRAEFTAGSPLTLARNTTYWVVLDAGSGSGKLSVSTTASDESDRIFPLGSIEGNQVGWSIGHKMKVRRGSLWSDDTEGRSFRMALNGTTDPFPGQLILGIPQVGVGIRPLIQDDSERIKNESWQWQRGDTIDGTFTDIPAGEGGTVRRFVPSQSDLGKWLRVSVSYTDGFGPGNSVSAATMQPVVSRPVVSNAGRANVFGYSIGSDGPVQVAQAFTTGGESSGYILGGLRLGVDIESLVNALTWTLHADDGGKPAAVPLFDPLTVAPDTLDQNEKTFEDLPHPGYLLAPNTKYWAVLTATSLVAANDDEDEGAELQLSAMGEFGASKVFDGIVSPLDPGSEPGWSLDYSVLADYEGVKREEHPPGWISFARALDGQWTKSVLRMSVLTHPEVSVNFEQATYTVAEGEEASITVKLNADPERTVTIPIAVTDNGGATDADYSMPDSVTFDAGVTEQTLTFMAVDDTVDDDDESVSLTLGTQPVGVEAGTISEALVSITDDDDPEVEVSFGAPAYSVDEGGTQSVSVELNADPERTVVVLLAKTEQGGVTSADYSGIPDSVTFNAGETTKSFSFEATQDSVDDDAESVLVGFGSLPARVGPGAHAEVTLNIEDDDGTGVTVSKALLTIDEQGSGTYTIVLDSEPTAAVIVTPNVDSSAMGVSVDPPSLSFDEDTWSTLQTVTVSAAHDDDADDEEATITHAVASTDTKYGGASAASVVVQVRDDDETVTFGQPSYMVAEGSEVEVTVTLSEDPERTVVIPIETTHQDGATSDDYSMPDSVTFNAGETEQTITFKALDDAVEDDGESVLLSFGTLPTGVTDGSTVSSTVSITESCISGDIWCGTMSLRVSRELGMGRKDLVTDKLDTDEFLYNGFTYGVRGIALKPMVMVEPSPPFLIPERSQLQFVLWNLSATDTEGQWTMPNEDYLDWTMHISTEQDGALLEAELRFSDAKHYLGDLWTWYGLDLDELNKAWTEDRLYKLRIVEDDRAERTLEPPGPPLYLQVLGTNSNSMILRWAWPQTRNDAAPPGVSYTIQWKAAGGDWGTPADVSTESTGPLRPNVLPTWTIRGLNPATTYDVRVLAVNTAGDSDPSNVVSGTTQPPLPTPQPQQAPNSPPTGWPGIIGSVQIGQALIATTDNIADPDGLTNPGFTYQWIRYDFGTQTDTNIGTGPTYTVTADDENKSIKVKVTFTDDAGNEESLTSNAYAFSSPLIIPDDEDDQPREGEGESSEQQQAANNEPTGGPVISGTPTVGETLTASTSGIADADGMTDAVFAYRWILRDLTTNTDTDTEDGTSSTYVLADADEGKAFKVRVTFTDDAGNVETLTSAATEAVSPRPNRDATGAPAISGTPRVGETLTAATSGIADADGLNDAVFSYRWVSHNPVDETDTDIEDATSSTYTVTEDDQGKAFKVRVTFTDDAGHVETLTSAATAAVPLLLTAAIHDKPTAPHDGENAFTFELRFSETPEEGFSYKTLKNHAFTVTGGEVINARRLEKPHNIRWEITVRPDVDGDVVITLPATTNCDDDGAICTDDGRMLYSAVKLTVKGPSS